MTLKEIAPLERIQGTNKEEHTLQGKKFWYEMQMSWNELLKRNVIL